MIISFFEVTDIEKKRFSEEFTSDTINFFEDTIQDVDISKYIDSDVLCVFVHSRTSKEILEKLPNIKLIATRSTGLDHIDTTYCQEKNISVKNVPLYGENTVAEHTFALILSLSRKIHKSYVRSTSGNFSTEGLQGFDLKDKTIGIVGGRKDWYACS